MVVVVISSCKNGGAFNKISIKNLVDPDKTPPIVSISSTPIALTGDTTYNLTYSVEDNIGGSGIRRLEIYYSPDGNLNTFKYIGNGPVGLNVTAPICIPNKNHPQPTFKVVGVDRSNNKKEILVGNITNYSIAISNPVSPTLTSSNGLVTNLLNTTLSISTCSLSQCSSNSLKYEDYPSATSVLFNNAAQPAFGAGGWLTCTDVLTNHYLTTPNFTVEGPYTYKVWTKTASTDFDNITPINLVSNAANSITVVYDVSAPALTIAPIAVLGGGIPNIITFAPTDANGIGNNKVYYSEDGVTFVEVSSNATSPFTFTPPVANVSTAKIKVVTTDTGGNTTTTITPPFSIDSINPLAPISALVSPYITSSSNVTFSIANCVDTAKIILTESPIEPSRTDTNWQNCSVGNLSQTLTGPVSQGIHNLYIWAKDAGGNISPSTTFNEVYDTVAPAINLTPFNALYKGGDVIPLAFTTTDINGISAFKLEYSPDGITYGLVATLATNATTYNWTVPVANTSAARLRLTSSDGATTTNTQVLTSTNFTIDTTPPATAALFVEGTVITGKSFGTYRINDCSDVAKVLIQRGGSGTPLSTAPGWQTCSDAAYSLNTNDFVPGLINLKFWVKDGAENVAPAYLPFDTTYNPPTFTVVNGPTISTPIADITIQFCDEAGISKVLFNETGVQPIAADVLWQSCNTAIGALKSQSLSPGAHTLKAFFKYNDGVRSLNPIDVYVNYTANLTWFEPPSVNRPQTKFSLATCAGIDKVFLKKGAAPLVTDAGWVNCTTALGGLTFDGLSAGVNTVTAYFKDNVGVNGTLFSNYASTTATYIPPQANLNNGTTVQDSTAALTITDCNNISKVLVTVDDATVPLVGDGRWVNCSTANNAINSPVLSGLGAHTLYTFFKYTDNYVLPDPDIDNIVFDPYDVTPPDLITGGTPITMTLENGFGASPYLLVKNKLTYVSVTYPDHVSRAEFTINTCNPTGSSDPKESIASVLITSEAVKANVSKYDPYWQACTPSAKAIQSATMSANPDIPLYFYFKDAAGNIAGYHPGTNPTQTVHVKVDTNDVSPPDRPYVEITTPPVLTTSPAQLWVNDPINCSDVDQVFINIYSRKYDGLPTETLNEAMPNKSAAGWQNCKVKTGSTALTDTFNFPIILSGSYTLQVWFKDTAGNINTVPRQASFIFNPTPSPMPNPIAHWSFDVNHIYKNKAIDLKGSSHLGLNAYTIDDNDVAYGKVKAGFNFSSKYGLTKNTSTLKPTVSVSMSVWANLTQNDAANKFIAGNLFGTGGYGLVIESGFLRFYVNGRKTEIATSTYTTGIHNIVGTADGRFIKLYIDGSLVGTPDDAGTPANINQGTSTVFAVGANPTATTNINTGDPRYFNSYIDELVVWDKYLSDTQVFRHYVDGMNVLKVNEQHVTPSPTMPAASFYGEFMQNALLTMPTCNNIRFVYVNETTHPPGVNSNWQPCSTLPGAIVMANLPQGYHQIKVWTKDEYDNLSTTYSFVDTTITGLVYQAPPETYFTLDNQHYLNTTVRDLFSGLIGDNLGGPVAQSGQTGVGYKNEGFSFTRANSQALEALYASPTQIKDKVTLSSWAYLVKNDSGQTKTISGNTGYNLSILPSGYLQFQVYVSGGGTREISIPTSSYETGYHNIIGSYDGHNSSLYLDGNPVATIDDGAVKDLYYNFCLNSFTIGAGASCSEGPVANTFFNGGIDEVIIWHDALTPASVYDFFNGQDNVPPLPVAVIPKGNSYNINIPIASFKTSSCADAASVFVTLGATKPTANAANWQACSSTNFSIKSPLLDDANSPATTPNLLHFWFKDAAGNVSDTSTDVTMNYLYDFTVPNPMAYWPFDLTNSHDQVASDVFGGHDAVKTDMGTTSGTADEAVTLNGSTSFAEVPYSVDFDLQDKVTLSIWFKIAGYPAGAKNLIGNFSGGGYAIMMNNSNLVFKVQTNNITPVNTISFDLTTAAPALDFSKWHHAAAVYDRGLMRLFYDDVQVATTTLPDITSGVKPKITYAQNNSLIIGANPTTSTGASGGFFNASLDEASTFNDALTDTVISEIYARGINGDKTAYDVTPPTIPVNLNIIYYNSLVSRANLTVTDCTGLNYIIVTNSKFPPDKNDEDWQLCNTMTGGLLSKELSTSDSYGKLWTKDIFGNISRSFNYVPISTKYDKPIQRPAAHWTFDSAHYNATNKRHIDHLGKIEMQSVQLYQNTTQCDIFHSPASSHLNGHSCWYVLTSAGLASQLGGVLNGKIQLANEQFLRVDNTSTVTPTDKLSVSSWVYVVNNYDPGVTLAETHVVSTWEGGKGYAIRAVYDPVNPRIEFAVKPVGQALLAPYLETKNFATGWHLVLGTYDATNGEAKLYIDGIFTKKFTAASPANIEYTPGVKFMVGSNPNTSQYPDGFVFHGDCGMNSCPYTGYNGKQYPYNIDEVLVWKKVVTALEASSLYHNGADVLYPTDVTAPAKPTLALENSRPKIDTNKAYFSLSTCSDISGVLVNEGTRPDKQDDRWQVCRTRLGSFGIKNLTPGGHTVTFWFKDLAGNVTLTSQDGVVDYLNNPTPRANAYWPMDAAQLVSNYTRDLISTSKEHEMVVTGINRDNPTAGTTAAKVHEGLNLAGGSFASLYDGLAVANSSRLVRPVNYMTVGGWYYLTGGEAGAKTLVDNLYETAPGGGYKLYMSGGNLYFKVALDLTVPAYGSNNVSIGVATSSFTTGWHHVLGVWNGLETKLYIDNVKVANSSIFPEENFMRYIDNSNNPMITYFRIGADSETNALPGSYFNDKVDEQAVWGFDLSTAQVSQAYAAGVAGNNLETSTAAPDDVDNAFVYYYDTFGSRARITMLDCTNTPYIYVNNFSGVAVAPLPNSVDWVDCRLELGAILSEKLPLGSGQQYVNVWSKNIYGVVSSIPATLEIPLTKEPDTLILPKAYFSLNAAHYATPATPAGPLDFLGRRTGSLTGASFTTTGASENGLLLQAGKYFTTNYDFNMYYTRGFTAGFWAYLTIGDATSQILLSPPADPQALKIYLSGGLLNFNIRRALDATYYSKTDYTPSSWDIVSTENFTINYPTASLPYTGWYFISATYDLQNMSLYLNGDLIANDNAPRMQSQTLVNRPVTFTSTPYFRLGDATTPFTNKVDELMMWDFPLTQKELIAHYVRVAHPNMSADVTAPTTAGRTLTIKDSTFTTKWTSESTKPYLTINDCSDVTGILIKTNSNVVPRYDDVGWQLCNTRDGGIEIPTLGNINGDNNVYVWFKDAAGNVNSVPLSTVIANVQNQTLLDNPVAYWSFDNISKNDQFAFDYGPSHLRTELYGTGSSTHTSAADNALTFDSNRGYAKVEASSAYKPVNQLSTSYWYNTGGVSYCNNDEHLFGTGNKLNGFTVRLDGQPAAGCSGGSVNYGALVFELTTNGTRKSVRVPAVQIPSGWVHIVHVFDGRKLTTYINGDAAHGGKEYVVDLKSFTTINYDTDQDPLIIGAAPNKLSRPTELDEYFSGSIDELAIFNKTLYPHHVYELYQRGLVGTKVSNPARTLENNTATLNARISVHQPTAAFTYGSRIKATISNCTDMDLVLVNNSTVQPSATDPDWQKCNTATGGILSAPIGTNLAVPTATTPRLWVRTHNGVVSTNYGTAASFTMPANMDDITRPTAYWTMDSISRSHQDATDSFEFIGQTITKKPVGFSPSTISAITEDGFLFDGFSSYLEAKPSPNTNPMINMTVTSWAYLKKGETSLRTIVSNSEGAAGAGLRTYNNKLEFFLNILEKGATATVANIDSVKTYMSIGVDTNSYETGWHHVAGVYDGKFLKLYLDSVLVNSFQIQFYDPTFRHLIFHDDTTPWFVGADPSTTVMAAGVNVTSVAANTYYDEKIDEFSIFNTPLSQTEIYYLYLYGSQFRPGVIDNAIAPTDPGVLLDPNASTTSTPFAFFTTPSCTGTNSEQINAIYVTVNGAPAPAMSAAGWQKCNIDPRGIVSPLLSVGSNTISVYLKDNDNDMSAPINYTITYTPPTMPNPFAYWTMNNADRSGVTMLDRIGLKHLRAEADGNGFQFVSAVEGQGYQTVVRPTFSDPDPLSNRVISKNWSQGLYIDKDFSVSLWYYSLEYIRNGTLYSKPGTFAISRNASDNLVATIVTTSGTYSKTTTEKMAPNSWNHITLTRSGTVAKIFLNSKMLASFIVSNANLAQSEFMATLIDTKGVLDDVSLFNVGLTNDQVLYNYYLGAKSSPSDLTYAVTPNVQPAPVPSNYWTFNNADLDMTGMPTIKLKDITGSAGGLPLTLKEDETTYPTTYMQTGQVASFKKVGEAFYLRRRETVINNPATDVDGVGDSVEFENIVGVPEYLEASTSLDLNSSFSFAGWVDFSKTTSHGFNGREYYTIMDQWGDTALDQSFRLYYSHPNPGNRNLVFEFRTTTLGSFTLIANAHVNLSLSAWHHVAVIRKNKIVTMYVDNIESGSINIGTLESLRVPVTAKLRFGETNLTTTDEGRFEGYLDEWAAWSNTALNIEQLDEIYNKGVNGNALTTLPIAVLAGVGSTTSNLIAPLTLNSCNGFSDVWVGFTSDATPLDTDSGWQTCSNVPGAILTKTLTANSLNNVKLWFKTGAVVSGYTFPINITHVTTDNVAPIPPTIAMTSGTPTTSSFSYFTLSTCADGGTTINGVYVGTTGSPPTSSQSGWVSCTTNASGLRSFPLKEGVNNISFWFKDAAGNIALGAEAFAVTYNPPALPNPNIYLAFTYNTGTPMEFATVGNYVRDATSQIPFGIINPGNTAFKFFGVVEDGAQFTTNSYVESLTYTPTNIAALSVSAWINIPAPASVASIINQWDGTAANNSFAVTIDSLGRLCFDFQTTASAGLPNWSTNVYRHSCSLDKISFTDWNHVAVTRNGANVSFFINGTAAGTDTIEASNLKTTTIPLRIAAQQRGGGYTIDGQIDEVLFYTSALATNQIEKIYARGFNNVEVFDEIQPQSAPLPFNYFDFDSANYDNPTARLMKATYPTAGAPFYFTDLDAGPANNFTTNNTPSALAGDSRDFYGKNILESNITSIAITADFSMSVWVKPNVFGNGHVVVNKWEDPIATPTAHANNQFQLVFDDSFGPITSKFYYHTTATTTWNTQGYGFLDAGNKKFNQDGNWHNVTVTRFGKYLSLYVDGELASMADIGVAPFVDSPRKLKLGGANNSGSTTTFIGIMDEFSLWDKALTERQVVKNYLLGKNLFAVNTQFRMSAAHHTNTIKTTTAKISISDCTGHTHVLVQATAAGAPLAGDGRWVACSTAVGAITSPVLSNGANPLELWMKNGAVVDGATSANLTITVTP